MRAGELCGISQQEIGQRRTGSGIIGRGAEDRSEDSLAATVHRIEAAPAEIAAHLKGVRSLVPGEVVGYLKRILDIQIRAARTQWSECIAPAGQSRGRENDVGEHLHRERVHGDAVLVGEIDAVRNTGDLETAVVTCIAGPRLVDDRGRKDVRVVDDGSDGVVDVVRPAADEAGEVARVDVGLESAGVASENRVFLRDLVVDPRVVLIGVERLAGDVQEVGGLRVWYAEIGLGNQSQGGHGAAIELRGRNLVIRKWCAGNQAVVALHAGARIVDAGLKRREVAGPERGRWDIQQAR